MMNPISELVWQSVLSGDIQLAKDAIQDITDKHRITPAIFINVKTDNFPKEIERLQYFDRVLGLELTLTQADEIPDFAGAVPNLEYLTLTCPNVKQVHFSFHELKHLETLAISQPKLLEDFDVDLSQCPALVEFWCDGSNWQKMPQGLHLLRQISCWNHPQMQMEWGQIPFTKAEDIRLDYMALRSLPDNPSFFPKLKELSIEGNPIAELPETICNWGELSGIEIDVSKTQIESLPHSLLTTERSLTINLQDTPFERLLSEALATDATECSQSQLKAKQMYHQLRVVYRRRHRMKLIVSTNA
jgi:Leucine-rich repeat (LRR) protein